jgi:hypothetical protein
MKRVRISPFQVQVMRVIAVGEEERDGASRHSWSSKLALFGKGRGLTASQRVTLHRSVQRLIANGMVWDNGGGWCRLTEKGQEWLARLPADPNPMAPYAPDLSDWDPDCGLSWRPWPPDVFPDIVAAVLEHDPDAKFPVQLSPRWVAEKTLEKAWENAKQRAFDAYLDSNPGEDDGSGPWRYAEGHPRRGNDRWADAEAAGNEAGLEELKLLRAIVVRIVSARLQ